MFFLFVNGFFCFVERIGLRCGKDVCVDGDEASDWQAVVEVAGIIVPLLCHATDTWIRVCYAMDVNNCQ